MMTQSFLFLTAFVLVALQASVFSTSIYMHRSLAHNALSLHPAAAWFFRLHLWLFTAVVPRQWVAVHRKHHRFPDQEGDPHSPKREGLLAITLGNYFYYKREIRNRKTQAEYLHDIKPDAWDRWLFDRDKLGLAMGIGLSALILGWLAGPLAYLAQGGLYILLSGVVNGICHRAGYKNFDNTATNLAPAGWFIAGEGWHNNHHGHPESPKFSVHPLEFDPSWPVIRTLAKLGLATHRPPATLRS